MLRSKERTRAREKMRGGGEENGKKEQFPSVGYCEGVPTLADIDDILSLIVVIKRKR